MENKNRITEIQLGVTVTSKQQINHNNSSDIKSVTPCIPLLHHKLKNENFIKHFHTGSLYPLLQTSDQVICRLKPKKFHAYLSWSTGTTFQVGLYMRTI